jgi:hypothetical protein
MFSRTYKTTTEHMQPVDDTVDDEVIESKINGINNILW